MEKRFVTSWFFHQCQQALLAALLAGLFGTILHAQDIRIRVLDGRNGHRVTNERLNVWIGPERGEALLLPTNKDGVAELHLDNKHGESIEVESNLYVDCRPYRKDAPRPSYSVQEVLQSGVVTQNACGKGKIEASPKPGELIFFVRPLHWWEGMKL